MKAWGSLWGLGFPVSAESIRAATPLSLLSIHGLGKAGPLLAGGEGCESVALARVSSGRSSCRTGELIWAGTRRQGLGEGGMDSQDPARDYREWTGRALRRHSPSGPRERQASLGDNHRTEGPQVRARTGQGRREGSAESSRLEIWLCHVLGLAM